MKDNKEIIKYVKKFYIEDTSGHGFEHIERVLDYAKTIQHKEGGDWNIIFLSVLFHDIHRIMSNKQKRYVSPEESLAETQKLLKDINIDQNTICKVLYIIGNHEKKRCPQIILN